MSQQNCSLIRCALCALALLSQGCVIVEKEPETSEKGAGLLVSAREEDRWTTGMVAAGHLVNGVAPLSTVRTAKHSDFERIVFEFNGTELPNYKVEYRDTPPAACGFGNTVSVPGDMWLEIRFEPAAAHDQNGQANVSKPSLAPTLINLRAVEQICDFESVLTWVAGVTHPNRYRVMELQLPTRLVVDVR